MNKVLLVAWREFVATAMTPVFIISSVVIPVLMIGVVFLIPSLMDSQPKPLTGTLAVLDPGGALAKALGAELEPSYLKERAEEKLAEIMDQTGMGAIAPDEAVAKARHRLATQVELKLEVVRDAQGLDPLLERLRSGEVVAIVSSLPRKKNKKGTQQRTASKTGNTKTGATSKTDRSADRPTLYYPRHMTGKHSRFLEQVVALADQRMRIERAGLGLEVVRDLGRRRGPITVRLTQEGKPEAEGKGAKIAKELIPFAFLMLLWMSAFVGGNYLLTTTIEEKSNKVMEVLLSAVSPMQLMAGKIVGQALVGLLMLAAYGTVGVLTLTALAFLDLIEPIHLVYLAVYFVMAYFMIAAMMAGIGSAVSDLREAQSLLTPVMLIVVIPLLLQVPILEAPNGVLAVVTSFLPPAAPFVMILRLTAAGAEIPMYQVILSIVWGYGCTFAMVWMAAKMFRVGVLMQGKPPTPLELLKWVRYD